MTIYDTPYEIHVTEEGINQDIAESLVELARHWPTYPSTYQAKQGRPPERVSVAMPCRRCTACDCVVLPDDLAGRLAHLTSMHGYRMNGRRYDNENRLLCIDDYADHDWDQPAGRPPTVCIRCDVLKEEVTG
jgi:hypothetical protein